MKKIYSTLLACLLSLPLLSQAQCPVAATCTPGPASSPQAVLIGMGIFNVTLGSINNTTLGTSDGYQDYSCTLGTTLSAGQTYPISIQTNAGANENVRVWLDWNNDGVFSPTTELLFSSDNKQLHTGFTNALPATAITGQPLRLRVAADASTSPLPTPCGAPQYSQVEDYRVTLQANTQPPTAGFTIGTAQACAGTFAFRDQSQRQPASWRWTFGDGSSSTQQNPTHTYAQPGTYPVQLRVCNTFGCDSVRQTATFFATYPAAATCQPTTFNYCCNYGITRVDFGSFSQESANGQAGYEDYSCTSRITVAQGQVVPLRLATASPQDTWVYLDANNDGAFTPNELLFQALNRTNPQGFVTIPRTTLTGQPLRLRLISDAVGTSNGALTPCANRTSGQVEDYAVVVTPTSCPATVQAGRLEYYYSTGRRMSTAYDSVAVALLLRHHSPGATIQWERSPNVTPPAWQPVPGATGPARFYTHAGSVFIFDSLYRAAISCAGSTSYSNIIRTWYPNRAYLHDQPCSGGLHIQRVALNGTTLDNSSVCNTTQGDGYRLFDPTRPAQTATVMRGALYTLRVTTSLSSRVTVYVGTDQQRLLPIQTALGSTAGSPTNILLNLDSLLIPAGTAVLHLRIRCDQNYARWPTSWPIPWDGNIVGGETEDYLLRVVPYTCAEPVSSGLITQVPTTLQCPRDTFNLRFFNETPGTQLQWQRSPDSLTWQNVTGQTSHVLRTQVNATTYYRVQVQGCSRTVYSPVVWVRAQAIANCYCVQAVGPVPATAPVISRVQIVGTTLDNASPATSGGPGRVSFPPTAPSRTAELVRGGTYTLLLTLGNTPAPANAAVHAAAWLDLDRNGVYDSLEWVHLLRTPGGTGTTYQVTLPVAASAQPGTTGLRLRVGYNLSYRPVQACTAMAPAGQGEIEDYTVTIMAAPCAGTLTAGNANAVPGPAGRTRLRSIGYTLGADLQWQYSYDSLTWHNITGAVTDELPVWSPASIYYRLQVECGGATTASRALQARIGGFQAGCANDPPYDNATYAYVDEVAIGGTPLTNVGSSRSAGLWYSVPYSIAPNGPKSVGYWPPQQQGFTATLVRGQSYPLRLVGMGIAHPSIPNGTSIGAWLDWNQDGSFDASEYYGGTANTIGRFVSNSTFTVPATAALGTLLMRVRTGKDLQSTGGCTVPLGSSETEEYMLTIADQAPLAVPTLTASLCVGQPLRLEATGAGAGATYRWLGPNGFQATGAVATRASFAAADAGTYIAVVERPGERLLTSLYVPPAPPCLPIGTATRPALARPALAVFPNPTTGHCTVRLSPDSAPLRAVVLRNATGQAVAIPRPEPRRDAAGTDVPLDLRGLPAGLYLVELRTEQGNAFGKVLVE